MSETAVVQKTELLQVADAVAREKAIDREQVLEAMEQAIQKAGRSKYGQEHDIRAIIDRRSGEISLARYIEVVEDIENEVTQVTLDEAHQRKSDAVIGEFIVDSLPPIDFGRIPAQTAYRRRRAPGSPQTSRQFVRPYVPAHPRLWPPLHRAYRFPHPRPLRRSWGYGRDPLSVRPLCSPSLP